MKTFALIENAFEYKGPLDVVEGPVAGRTPFTLDLNMANLECEIDEEEEEDWEGVAFGNVNVYTNCQDVGARQWIADRGYDPKMGARPMARVIQEHIKRPLAEVLLFGELADGGDVLIELDEDADELRLIPTPNTKKLQHLSAPESSPGQPH